jgi:hypothetical protein
VSPLQAPFDRLRATVFKRIQEQSQNRETPKPP